MKDREEWEGRVPIEILFLVKFLFYFFIGLAVLYILHPPPPSQPSVPDDLVEVE